MLVSRGLVDTELEIRERMIVEAFAGGWAGENHYDEITDMRNVLTIGASHKKDESALAMCSAVRIPMANIRQRYAETKRMGITGDELRLLREFLELYRDFWLRQPVSLYLMSCDALNRAHKMNVIGQIKEAA